jgi:hypothetical protein
LTRDANRYCDKQGKAGTDPDEQTGVRVSLSALLLLVDDS